MPRPREPLALPRSGGDARPAWSRPGEVPPAGLNTAVARLVAVLGQAGGAPASGLLLDCTVAGVRLLVTREGSPAARPTVALSPRELEIARMVGLGHTNKRIAAVLEISGWTVSAHVRRIFDKLGVSSRAAMVAALAGDPALSWTADRPSRQGDGENASR